MAKNPIEKVKCPECGKLHKKELFNYCGYMLGDFCSLLCVWYASPVPDKSKVETLTVT